MDRYVPNYGDLENFRYERLVRTKSRAYQIVCWQGYLGTHEFFLGRTFRGWIILLFTTLSFLSFFIDFLLGFVLLVCVISINMVNIRYIASTDPNSDIYGDECGPIFYSLHMISRFSLLWDTNFWEGKDPTDPDVKMEGEEGYSKI